MLLELPLELLLIIVNKLDLHSKITLYNVCHSLRNVLTFHDNKTVDLSKSTLATAATLQEKFFKDVSAQIQYLSLRTVPNITKSVLLPTIRRLTSLKYLNVSFTSVVIPDVIEILKVAPTLTGISVNFEFGNVNPCQLPPKMMIECQNLFEKLTDVEFVGSAINLLYSPVPYYVLKKTRLDSLKYSVIKCQHANYNMSHVVTELNVKYMAIFLTNWKEVNIYYGRLTTIPFLVRFMHSNKYEFVLIKRIRFSECKVYTSAAFKGMFYQKFKVCEQALDNIALEGLKGNVAIFLWNKELNTFDSQFFCKFFERVKCFFPQCIEKPDTFEFSSSQPDWFYLTKVEVSDCDLQNNCTEPATKKKRTAPSFTLDYDNCLSQTKEIELTINLEMVLLPAAITPNLNYLKKITYLSLAGRYILYTVDFFEVLFKTCDKLCTLNVEACGANYSRYFIKSIILSKSLRNLRIVDRRLNHKALFHSLSQCVLLENVHIVDEGTEVVDIGDISCIIANCPNLYSLFFQVPMSNSAKLKALRLLNKAKSFHNRSFLKIELDTDGGDKSLSYDPLMEVFKISPIKPI